MTDPSTQPCRLLPLAFTVRVDRLARYTSAIAVIVLIGLLPACKTNDTPDKKDMTVSSEERTSELPDTKPMKKKPPFPGEQPGVVDVPMNILQSLTEAVAKDAGVDVSEVVLDRAEKVTWRDGSLGCPQPDQMYTQALVEGYWAVFHVGREEYDLRVTDTGAFSRCTGSTKQAPIIYDDT